MSESGAGEIEGVDLEILDTWMDEQGLPAGPIEAIERLEGGTQNILFRFARGGRRYVLRRPPIHKRANSDETMRREARVLAALAGTDVPHPGLIAACPDEGLLGAAFYLMEPVDGFNAGNGPARPARGRSGDPARHGLRDGGRDRCARLRSTIGRSGSRGSVDRTAISSGRFRAGATSSRATPNWRAIPVPRFPASTRSRSWLEAHRPSDSQPGILHGDYHIANVMFSYDGPELAAIIDWELATVGDPLLDLGALVASWPDDEGKSPLGNTTGVMDGLPSARAR